MRVLLAGGGTAGHTSPLIATADALRRLVPEAEITCLGTPRGLETRVVPEAGYPLELIPPVPLPRKPNADLFKVPSRLRGAVKETLAILDRIRPDVVVGYGGYVSMPAYLAARRRHLPLVIHEQNSLPGLANKAGARIASRVAVSFPDTPLPRAEYVGLPIRRMISQLDRERDARRGPCVLRARPRPAHPARHRRLPGRAPPQPVAVSGASRILGEAGVQVLHVVGPKGEARARAPPSTPYVVARLRRPDGPRASRSRPDRSAGRAPRASPRPRRSACPRCSCRSRSATASRSTTPATS